MTVARLEILVEEPSAEAFLGTVIPRMAPGLDFFIHPFQGKGDLLKKLPDRLRAYQRWLPEDWRVLVLVDSDGGDCVLLKNKLEQIASEAGLTTRSESRKSNRVYRLVTRIVVQELEAWYFGDWEAVCEAFPKVSRNYCAKIALRTPDRIDNTWETFEKALKHHGYLRNCRLPKIATAKTMAQHIGLDRNISTSFNQFKKALLEL